MYDLENNEASVSVGISHDTAEFAVTAIERWCKKKGSNRYPAAKRLLITADSGGSNSPRTRLWRWELQRLANRTGLTLERCHYPPCPSKWNKIEHRLFCHITRNWQGIPLAGISQLDFGQRTPLASGSQFTFWPPPAATASLHFLKIVVLVHAHVWWLNQSGGPFHHAWAHR